MRFDKRPEVSLGRRRHTEETREELLSKVKAERQAREQDRAFLRAATVIQKIHRGTLAREQFQQQLISDWLAQHGSHVADVKYIPDAAELAEAVLPPVLQVHLPFNSLANALRGDALQPMTLRHKGVSTALRGCLALALRSIAAAKQDSTYLGGEMQSPVRQCWVRQNQKLMLLCGCLLGARQDLEDRDRWELIESAAARLLWSLTHWQPYEPGYLQLELAFQQLCSKSPTLAAAVSRMIGATGTQKAQRGSHASETALVSTLKAALSPLETQGNKEADKDGCAHFAALHLMTTAHLANRLPGSGLAYLCQPAILSPCMQAVKAMTESKINAVAGPCWLWLLANLVALAAGKPESKVLEGGRSIRFFRRSAVFEESYMPSELLTTGLAILRLAASAVEHEDSSALKDALDALWPLSDGTFVNNLLTALKPSQEGGLPAFASFYSQMFASLTGFGAATATPVQKLHLPLNNALAFGNRDLLSRLWRWLAVNLGLPLEAPAEATRGWNIESLRQGVQGLPQQHAPIFGLFCRVYAHFLLVVDDEDFNKLQLSFNLGQQRAIATALNTLVFRTHCPEARPEGQTRNDEVDKPLRESAPVLLRALYERDVRQRYCPPALWLAPYSATSGEETFSARGVVAALLSATSAGDTNARGGSRGRSALLASLLLEAPQCVPFNQRVEIFRCLVETEKQQQKWDVSPAEGGMRSIKVTARRDSLLEDGFAALRSCGLAIKGRLEVVFVNSAGALEAGLDHGGLVKEFLEEVVKAGFNADYGLMTCTSDGLAYPQPAAVKLPQGLGLLEFLGTMLAKALYEGILLDWPLAPFFVARLQGRRPLFDELSALDADLHRNLLMLKRYEGDAEDLGLSFAVEDETFGTRTVIPMLPGGDGIAVTSANKLHYIQLLADWHLNGRLGGPAAAFAKGMAQVIPAAWLRLFNPREVNQLLAGGESGGIDIADMAAHTQYSGGYSASSPTVKLFWKVMREMSIKERQGLLKFATSCSRAPLGGFSHLRPPFVIHKVPCSASPLASFGGKDVERLPSASTCYNMLKLPNYRRASTMHKCLVYAASSNTGFELS